MSAQTSVNVSGEPDWDALRAEFPATGQYTYLDIGRKALLPRVVKASTESWFDDVYSNIGGHAFDMGGQEETREAVADVFGAPRSSIALVKNTSEGISIVAAGFPWVEGDNVVISSLEHENNTFPWRYLARRGVEIRWAEPDEQGRVTVESYANAVDDRTRIIAVAYVAYGNGYRADLNRISEFCRDRDIRLIVDAIQGIGVLATPVSDLGADVLCAGGHKAQFSLTGAGFMYITDEMIDLLDPPYAAKFSFTSIDRTVPELELAPDAHRYEYGNPNFMGLWVQKRSAEFIASVGLENIEARVRDLTTYLIDELESRQIRVLTPRPWEERAGLVTMSVDGDSNEIEEALRARDIIVASKDGHIRAGVHFYNNRDDIDRFTTELHAVNRGH